MITIVKGASDKPASAQRLAEFFTANNDKYSGFLYIGYPIIGTAEGAFGIDALLISPNKGLVVFNLVESQELVDVQEAQDDCYNKIQAKLRVHKTLISGKKLLVEIVTVTFAPRIEDTSKFTSDEYPVCNENSLVSWLDSLHWENPERYGALLSVVQAISTIRKNRRKRLADKPNSRGFILKKLEESIANLDNYQSRAVIETVDGVQRIRGLAGSGKTVILALKAAYLHSKHPDWKIAVTFHTRSLKAQFRRLINTFVIEQTSEEPDWENLHVIHAWGSAGGGERTGLYYEFCRANGRPYYDFASARAAFGEGKEFEGACEHALQNLESFKSPYDVILVDEAQDFPPSFLRLCYNLLKTDKRLVYAYDELQNLSSKSVLSPEEIFGQQADGTPVVRLAGDQPGRPKQDIILDRCYRNSRPVLVTAHALGFGIYRDKDPATDSGLVQIFDQKSLWSDVGYAVTEGSLSDGELVQLSRTSESSPVFLEEHSPIDDLIVFKKFETTAEQARWVANSIQENLTLDELRSDDIVVINPDPLTTREEVGIIRKNLFDSQITSHLAGVDSSPDVFFDEERDSVAFTGIYRAKGNEAGMVYIINAQDCYTEPFHADIAKVRNRLFTAITRSKAWVRITGVGTQMDRLMAEYQKVRSNNFTLRFTYPTEGQRKLLNIVNRDMTEQDRRNIEQRQGLIDNIVDELESGKLFAEDIGKERLERLRTLLDKE